MYLALTLASNLPSLFECLTHNKTLAILLWIRNELAVVHIIPIVFLTIFRTRILPHAGTYRNDLLEKTSRVQYSSDLYTPTSSYECNGVVAWFLPQNLPSRSLSS